MSEVDDAIAAARSSWARIVDGAPAPARSRRKRRRGGGTGKRLARMLAVAVAILVAAGVFGALVTPLGLMGTLGVLLLLVAAVVLIAMLPTEAKAPPPDKLRTVDVKALPAQTERWLHAQRPALPAPAQHLVDRIGERLETLSPMLGRLEPEGEQALEVRRLVGEQLPAFVADYQRVPEPLRASARNGRTADQGLVDGLALIEREIAGVTERLAQGDLDSLQTRGRYLELKYGEER